MAAPVVLAGMCFAGCVRRRRDRVFPAIGFAASVAVGVHAFVEFSLQIPADRRDLRRAARHRRRAVLAHEHGHGALTGFILTMGPAAVSVRAASI